jgi:hypothetical protein
LHEIARHPLAGTFLGFILGVASTLVSNHFRIAEIQQQQERDRVAEGSALARDVATLIYERRTRASLLYASLKRNAEVEELKQRKGAYDKAYAEWNAQLQAKSLSIRSLTRSPEYTEIESYIQYGLTPHLAAIDAFVTAAYDSRLRHLTAPVALDTVAVDAHLQAALNCAYVISQTLQVSLATDKDARAAGPAAAAWKELEERCPRQ